jgi:hypothetical protein
VSPDRRYDAKLLFQTRIVPEAHDRRQRRGCEERVFVIVAPSARVALARALRRGRDLRHDYTNCEGKPVHYEFIGVMQLLRIDYSFYQARRSLAGVYLRKTPMERRANLIPAHDQLDAMRYDPPQV